MYFTYIKYVIKSQLEYRISTYLLIIAQFFAQFFFILSFYYLFMRFNSIKGYSYLDIIFIYGVFHTSFSIADMISRGVLNFSGLVKKGYVDIYLMRPRSLLLQVMGSNFEVSRVGRLIQAVAILIYAIMANNLKLTFIKGITLIETIMCGIILFFSIFLFFAAMTFWTINDGGLSSIFCDSSKDIFQYPVNVFNKYMKLIFTLFLPFAFINYYPILYLLGKTTKVIYAFSPLIVLIWFVLVLCFWKIGIKNYTSTGS